jgi:hypothetical protein
MESIYDVVQLKIKANRFTKKVKEEEKRRTNLQVLRSKSSSTLAKPLKYKPKVSEIFFEEWLNFPRSLDNNVVLNSFLLLFTWLLWINKSLASMDPRSTTIRERLCNTLSNIGTAAGLFLVLSVAGFLQPPGK